MRVLFVTYCFGDWSGQALIGVYKRGLRVAMELRDRGHDVLFYCTGREAYRDDLTTKAESCLEFVDFDFAMASFEAAEQVRAQFLHHLERLKLDLVVIGEAPMAGALLEATLCAVELGIPVVLLDNAYNGLSVEHFWREHGSMADGVILTGPSSQFMANPPPNVCQVPPYITSDTTRARRLLTQELQLSGRNLITVLAYDGKTESLGLSLLERVNDPHTDWVFLSRDTAACRERLAEVPESVRASVRVIPQPADPTLFGLIELSKLAIVKYGFMQVSECLSLRTPVIVTFHEGPRWLDLLPQQARKFAHATSANVADTPTVAAARRFLSTQPASMRKVHDGRLGATALAADFIERLPRAPHSTSASQHGFAQRRLLAALAALFPDRQVRLDEARSMLIRKRPEQRVYAILCRCSVDDQPASVVRLWGRIYPTEEAAEREALTAADSGRRVLHLSVSNRLLIEVDLGQALLPSI